MAKHELTKIVSKWMEGFGPQGDIVLASRIRLARNLKGIPFPHLLQDEVQEKVVAKVAKAVTAEGITKVFGSMAVLLLEELSPLEKRILVEKHLISPAFAEKEKGAVILNSDESVSIMVNEEDHLRVQLLMPALQLEETWKAADALDDALELALDFAFDEERGYLTACPTNLGTGLRASVMLHLPALVIAKQAKKILGSLSQLGLTVRGFYGEGSEAQGNLYQISNQITLGLTEAEIISNLSVVVQQLIDQERAARDRLKGELYHQMDDKAHRAHGLLAHARIISSEEALTLLSDLRLGIDLGIITNVEPSILSEMMAFIQPGLLQGTEKKKMNAAERDLKRAEVIQKKLNSQGR